MLDVVGFYFGRHEGRRSSRLGLLVYEHCQFEEELKEEFIPYRNN